MFFGYLILTMICKKCGMPEVVYLTTQYQYIESGLENIYLENVPVISCERCLTKRPQIIETDLLDITIAESLILKPFPLIGSELRFLRKNLEYSLNQWARLLHFDEKSLLDLEMDEETISPQFDLLNRLVYIKLLEEKAGQIIINNLMDKFLAIDFQHPDNLIVLINLDIPPKYYYLQPNLV